MDLSLDTVETRDKRGKGEMLLGRRMIAFHVTVRCKDAARKKLGGMFLGFR